MTSSASEGSLLLGGGKCKEQSDRERKREKRDGPKKDKSDKDQKRSSKKKNTD